jgi:translocation protein SEC63
MTDEKARENFLKYGNPDGKGSFAVGIALPRFL